MEIARWAFIAIFLAIAAGCWPYTRSLSIRLKKAVKANAEGNEKHIKMLQNKRRWVRIAAVVAAWIGITMLITALFGSSHEKLEISIFVGRMNIFGQSISESVFYTWFIVAGVFILSLLFRLFVVPHFQDIPKGLQNVLEFCVETINKYTSDTSEVKANSLSCWMLSIAIIMVGSAMIEMMGVRAPTSDLVMTMSLAFVAFILINYYSIKKKGLGGRLKGMASPSPVIFPIELISAISKPVSLACRLFGNMIGGMIVIDLIYVALGNAAVGIPAILGLYFNVFHPLIQAYIFITLTLTFVREAAE